MSIPEMIHKFDVWIYNSPTPGIIRDSKFGIPVIQTFHLVGITLLLGITVIVNLRLLNIGYREIPLPIVAGQLERWFRGSLVVTLASGFLVFIVDPVRYAHNTSFRLKMCLLILAIAYQFAVFRRLTRKEAPKGLSWRNLVPSAISILLWFSVGCAGRAIAFFG